MDSREGDLAPDVVLPGDRGGDAAAVRTDAGEVPMGEPGARRPVVVLVRVVHDRRCGARTPGAAARPGRPAMKLKISNRSDAFFGLFSAGAENMRIAAELLYDLMSDFTDVELKARRLQEREHEGDEVTHQVIQTLNTTFITPMDREDIYQLATALDDVVDAIEAAGDLMVLHGIEEPRPFMIQQADVLMRAATQTEAAIKVLDRLDRGVLEPYWIEINSLENEGDRVYRRSIADMFGGDHLAMDVLRWKEVSETLEEALDGLENVANIVEAVVLKHARAPRDVGFGRGIGSRSRWIPTRTHDERPHRVVPARPRGDRPFLRALGRGARCPADRRRLRPGHGPSRAHVGAAPAVQHPSAGRACRAGAHAARGARLDRGVSREGPRRGRAQRADRRTRRWSPGAAAARLHRHTGRARGRARHGRRASAVGGGLAAIP